MLGIIDPVAHQGEQFAPRPDRRGRGHGAAAASAATEYALRAAPVVEWRARGTNAPSIGIAVKLGFAHYGENLAIRLR